MSQQPNIVLISVDQWRGDCFSGAGHPVVMTPFLDGWMQQGVRFDRAYSASPTCIPARAALFTGLSQENHGRVGYQDGVPWDYDVTLAGELGRAGYQTQAVGKMHVYPERTPMGFGNVALHDGFLHFSRDRHADLAENDDYIPWLRQQLGYDADYFDHGVSCNSVVARPWDKPEYTHPTNWVVRRSIEFLRNRDASRPFFLYASFHRPHPPYDPPAWAFDQYFHDDTGEPPVGDWTDIWAEDDNPMSPETWVATYDKRMVHRARAGYYGHMSHIDQQLNRLFHELRAIGVENNTVICLVADHGEMLGDHHMWRKAYPYEGSAKIPFILTGPGIRGRQVDTDHVVELRDVMPTLLDAAGADVPDGLDGRSVLPLVIDDHTPDTDEQANKKVWREYLHGEHTLGQQSLQYLTDGREKYLWFSGTGTEQLFDIAEDPNELHDLARTDDAGREPPTEWNGRRRRPMNEGAGEPMSRRLAKWRARLVDELADRPEDFVADGALVPGRPVDAVLPFLRDRLKATGAIE